MNNHDSSVQTFRWGAATPEQRRVVVAAGLGWMLDAFDVMLYSIVLTTLMRAFGMSRTTAGFLNALTLAASALGGLLFGVLADRFGRRRMLSARSSYTQSLLLHAASPPVLPRWQYADSCWGWAWAASGTPAPRWWLRPGLPPREAARWALCKAVGPWAMHSSPLSRD